MVSFSKLGKYGNLGNQLFEIAATIGIAVKHGAGYVFPEWQHSKFFIEKIPQTRRVVPKGSSHSPDVYCYDVQVQEPHYHYADMQLDRSVNIDLVGWFQSEKYWKHCEQEVLRYFEFAPGVLKKVNVRRGDETLIALCVRRGDYIGNPNYAQLDLNYVMGGARMVLEKMEKTNDVSFLVFSDDVPWCRRNFPEKIEGHEVQFTTIKHPVEQLAQMTLCDHFVIANSSFSWWGAYLGEKRAERNGLPKKKTIVVAPTAWNAGELLKKADDRDVVPERWLRFNPYEAHEVELATPQDGRWDLSDVTFTIPVKRDSMDRVENLALNIQWLQYHFKTHIVVGESDETMRLAVNTFYKEGESIEYRFWKMKDNLFHRTKMLNQMAREAQTPIVVNWDCDVFVDPSQLVGAINKVRSGQLDGCYPYDGRFFRAPRERMYIQFKATLLVEDFKMLDYPKYQHTVTSYGGAVIWNREKFLSGGGENENMIDYGPEDYERFERFTKLGYKVGRVKGPIYHMDHDERKNGSKGHAFLRANDNEYSRIKSMERRDLVMEVHGWEWVRTAKRIPAFANDKKQHALWKQLGADAIYLINLKRRPDKMEHAREELRKVGLEGVLRYPAIDGYELQLKSPVRQLSPGMLGCYFTHQEIIRRSIESGFETIIIFEDDVEFMPGLNDFLSLALPQIPADWQFAYLGAKEYGGVNDYAERVNEYWVKPKGVWGTQAYAIRGRDAMVKVLNYLELMKMQLDNQLCKETLPQSGVKYYMIFPSVADQYRHNSSDVQVANPEELTFAQ